MSIDTNAPYKVPKEYEPKNKDFVPKTKPTSVFMIILGAILIFAFTAAIIAGAVFGVTKLVEAIQNSCNTPSDTSAQTNRA